MTLVAKNFWIPRFAAKLRELVPEVAGEVAVSLAFAESMFPEAHKLLPEEAAEFYLAKDHPSGAVPRPQFTSDS